MLRLCIYFVDLFAFVLCASGSRCKRLTNTLLHYITVSVVNDRVFMKAAGKVRPPHNEHTSQTDGP